MDTVHNIILIFFIIHFIFKYAIKIQKLQLQKFCGSVLTKKTVFFNHNGNRKLINEFNKHPTEF